MTHIAGIGRDQLLLLPEAVDDYVEVDNPVRFIDVFVDGLDLAAAGFGRVEAKATGRPGYAPGDLLKLYIYGYLNRVRSSRRLEREGQRNIEVIWLVRGLKPDFKTIADFRRDNRAAFRGVFRQFVLLCRRLDLYGRELLAVDGTRIKAVNNKDRNFTRSSLRAFIHAADERLEDFLKRLDEGDVADGATSGGARTKNLAEKIAALSEKRGRHQAMLAQLERTGEDQISLTDPDSRAMAAHTKVAVGYNIQVAVDAKHKLIVEQAVTNQVVDMGLLTQTAEPARQVLGVETIDVVADRGYFKIEDVEACERVGCIPHVPRPQRGSSVREGFFRKDEFRYDAGLDAYVCPAGKLLTPIRRGRMRDLDRTDYGNPKACRACQLRPRCTNDARSVFRLENEDVLDRMAERLKARPAVLDRRREVVEHPFGSIKQWMYQGAFLMRGLANVRAEFSLTALAYNLRRALNILGVEAMTTAVAA
ncbi:MAG TPA: IS1182 family transposase [Stellaceae bacterium]|nr:IS1182 family transposase [Stellaceae bacterium]